MEKGQIAGMEDILILIYAKSVTSEKFFKEYFRGLRPKYSEFEIKSLNTLINKQNHF